MSEAISEPPVEPESGDTSGSDDPGAGSNQRTEHLVLARGEPTIGSGHAARWLTERRSDFRQRGGWQEDALARGDSGEHREVCAHIDRSAERRAGLVDGTHPARERRRDD